MFKECLEIRWKIAHFCEPRPQGAFPWLWRFLHPWFLFLKSFCLRSVNKHSTQCFITKSNTPQRVIFSTLFSVCHLVMKHYVSYLICYVRIALTNLSAMWSRDLNSIASQQGDVAYFIGIFFISGNSFFLVC